MRWCKFIKTFAKMEFNESLSDLKEMRFSKKSYFKIINKLPTLIMTQSTMARNKGFQLMVFKVAIEIVEPMKNRVKFNPDFAAVVAM